MKQYGEKLAALDVTVPFRAIRNGRGFFGEEEVLIAIIQKACTPPASLGKGAEGCPKAV